jgi:hypothetical protein
MLRSFGQTAASGFFQTLCHKSGVFPIPVSEPFRRRDADIRKRPLKTKTVNSHSLPRARFVIIAGITEQHFFDVSVPLTVLANTKGEQHGKIRCHASSSADVAF